MSTTVITKRGGTIDCLPRLPCFGACHLNIRVTLTGPASADFGPTIAARALPNNGEVCDCTAFNIRNAQLLNPQQLLGASPPNGPFSQVVLTGVPLSDLIQAQFTLRDGGGFCSINYYLASGPDLLGVGYAFELWWAVVLAIVVFIVLLGCLMYYCGWCPKQCRRVKTKGALLSPPPPAATPADYHIPEAQVYVPRQGMIVEMTSIPEAAAPTTNDSFQLRTLPVSGSSATTTESNTPAGEDATTTTTTPSPPPLGSTYRTLSVQQEKAALFTAPRQTEGGEGRNEGMISTNSLAETASPNPTPAGSNATIINGRNPKDAAQVHAETSSSNGPPSTTTANGGRDKDDDDDEKMLALA